MPDHWERCLPWIVQLVVLLPGIAPTSAGQTVGSAAPEFPAGLTWLNTAAPLSLRELRGKVVLLDFWTYGCINCIHDFPWVKKLAADFPDTLVVIGVHSAKFSEEGNTRNIREIVLRYGIDYPVINDNQFRVWKEYEVDAWPTLILIAPDGSVAVRRTGEGFYPSFKATVAALDKEYAAKGKLDRRPLKGKLEKEGLPQTVLSFPGKVLPDATGSRLFIADTGHDRIVVAALDTGRVLSVIGGGNSGRSEFNHPEGMALAADGQTLYVADTGHHSLRQVNLITRKVTTLDGTGEMAGAYPPAGGTAPGVALNSPWALARDGAELYIAMAGCHQIWRMHLTTGAIGAYAGTGAEGWKDGPLDRATLAQPSGITIGADGRIYFADSEGSTIRYIDPKRGQVVTLAGPGDSLFDFGNRNGIGRQARFQHPLGIVAYRDVLYVADTYNSEIRVVNPQNGAVRTLCGGEAGWRDGRKPLFYEPGGIGAANGKLYVADTNNHSIRVINLASEITSTFVLQGMTELTHGDIYGAEVVTLPAATVAPGHSEVGLDIEFLPGYALNTEAPSEIVVSSRGEAVRMTGTTRFGGTNPRFPLDFPATFQPGAASVTLDLSLVYCREKEVSVCLIKQVRLVVPVTVAPGGAPRLTIRYRLPAGRQKGGA
jgi:DNA-binding beta-propeller fold protein YncE